jgi:hypothetical protein
MTEKTIELKQRMDKVMPLLPKHFLVEFMKINSKYDTHRGRNKIESMLKSRLVDEPLTVLFEKYVGI